MILKSKNKTGWMTLELDMEKAYDRVEWDFLWKTLKCFAWNDIWIIGLKLVSSQFLTLQLLTNLPRPSFILLVASDMETPFSFSLLSFIWKCCVANFLNLLFVSPGIGLKVAPSDPHILCLLFSDDSFTPIF